MYKIEKENKQNGIKQTELVQVSHGQNLVHIMK